MSTQEFKYTMNVSITLTGDEAKKNTVRDAILDQLNNALAAGNIDEATWSINQSVIPEGGAIK